MEKDEERDSVGSERAVGFAELTADPAGFYGERVSVSATVGRVIEPGAFSLVSNEAPEDEEPVEDEAVVVVGDSVPALSKERSVRVTGEVRRFDVSEVERELGVELDDGLYVPYGEKPAILARSVEPMAGGETTAQ